MYIIDVSFVMSDMGEGGGLITGCAYDWGFTICISILEILDKKCNNCISFPRFFCIFLELISKITVPLTCIPCQAPANRLD
jgi:hypothetical protein